MAYANTGLRCLIPRMGSGPALWSYTSADVHTDVDAAGYFSDGATFGLKVDDLMIVVKTSATLGATIHTVLNATTINPAILS